MSLAHLSQVELGSLLGVDTLELNQRSVGSRVSLSSLVSEHTTFDVETVVRIVSRFERRGRALMMA
jgi:hypothetical protein